MPRRLDHPISVQFVAHDAFQEAVHSHTAGIVNTRLVPASQSSNRILTEHIGSGCGIRWSSHKLLLTAKHVVEGANETDLMFFLRTSGQIKTQSFPPRASPREGWPRIQLRIARIIRCEWEDLAAIVLDSGEKDLKRVEFYQLPNKPSCPPDGTPVLFIGHPIDLATHVTSIRPRPGYEERLLGIFPMIAGGEIVRRPQGSGTLLGFRWRQHITVPWSPNHDVQPHGFSGTGMWFYRKSAKRLWTANPQLAGICVETYPRRKLLKIVRASVVAKFLRQSLS